MSDFTNSVQAIGPGSGTGVRYSSVDNVITNTASTTDTHIAPSPGLRTGRFRIRTKTVDASATLQFKVTVGDGTTILTFIPTTNATAAGEGLDQVYHFCFDISVTQFTVVLTVGGTTKTLTYDLEVV